MIHYAEFYIAIWPNFIIYASFALAKSRVSTDNLEEYFVRIAGQSGEKVKFVYVSIAGKTMKYI